MTGGGPDLEFGIARRPELEQIVFAAIVELDARDDLGMTAIEALRQPQEGRERLDRATGLAGQLPVAVVRFLRGRASMVPGDQPDGLDLIRLEPAEIAVLDQIVRMLVVSRIADMHADVVEQGRVFEPLAFVVGQLVDRPRLIEESQSQLRDLAGVLGPVAASIAELDHAAAPDVRIALDLRDLLPVALNVVENQAFAQGEVAERELVRPERANDGVEEHRTGHDQVGPARIQAGNLEALLQAQIDDGLAKAMQLLRRNSKVASVVGHAAALLGRSHGAQAENRTGGADHAIESGGHDAPHMIGNLRRHVLDELPLVLATDRIGPHEAFRQANHPELEALRELHLGAGSQRDLHASATDVDGHRRFAGDVHAVHRREVDESRFFNAGNDLRSNAGLALDCRQEFAAVLGFACRARRRRQDLVNLMRFGETSKLRQRLKRCAHRFFGERASTEAARSEPDHLFFAVDHLERQVGSDVDHDHVDRIRADVDGRYPHVKIGVRWGGRLMR